MSLKTIFIGLSLRFGEEKPVHGRPSWELARLSVKILARGVNLCRRNAASMIALESAEWFDFKSRLSLIFRVNVVLNRTVVVDSD